MLAALLNGQTVDVSQPLVHLDDRGLQYGDGLFETMRLVHGKVRFVDAHLARLQLGCERLSIAMPDTSLLREELQRLCQGQSDGVVKLLLTRGRGGRGYRPAAQLVPTRVWQLFAPPAATSAGITLRWCTTRLARHAQLAGIKHLNRLEQVLAQSEWQDATIAEGLMLDTEGELVCGTMSNVFLVSEGVLMTPDLRFSGVAGVMRHAVLQAAQTLKMAVEVRSVWPQEVAAADEVFVTNAVRGIQPVTALAEQQWSTGSHTADLQRQLSVLSAAPTA